MCRDATAGKFDIVAAWSVDRLGRSVLHLAQFVEDLRGAGVGLFLLKQGLDSETPTGRAMLGMCSVFAELEREIIRERIHAGLARARAQGKTLGRKPVSSKTEERIRELRGKGFGKLKIARTLRCGVSTVQRVLSEVGLAREHDNRQGKCGLQHIIPARVCGQVKNGRSISDFHHD
jgi:DNA invertase Pin-like site-specific DNA recombinase